MRQSIWIVEEISSALMNARTSKWNNSCLIRGEQASQIIMDPTWYVNWIVDNKKPYSPHLLFIFL